MAMVLVGLSMDPMLDLDLEFYSVPWIYLVLGPLRDIIRTLLAQANLDRHKLIFGSLSRH